MASLDPLWSQVMGLPLLPIHLSPILLFGGSDHRLRATKISQFYSYRFRAKAVFELFEYCFGRKFGGKFESIFPRLSYFLQYQSKYRPIFWLCVVWCSGFKEMLATPDQSPRSRSRNRMSEIARLQADPRARLASTTNASLDVHVTPILSGASVTDGVAPSPPPPPSPPPTMNPPKKDILGSAHKGFMTLGPKRRLQKALIKMNILPKNTITK